MNESFRSILIYIFLHLSIFTQFYSILFSSKYSSYNLNPGVHMNKGGGG